MIVTPTELVLNMKNNINELLEVMLEQENI